MIFITHSIQIPDEEIEEQFIRSSGPGGQHVNKTETGVQLRFNVAQSRSLPDSVRRRLLSIAGNRVSSEGFLVITATEHRSQLANREAARERLADLVRQATVKPKPRKTTRPSRAAKARRIDKKKQRGAIKKLRGRVRDDS